MNGVMGFLIQGVAIYNVNCVTIPVPISMFLPQMAIMAGVKWKAAPKDDFYQEVLDLLGDISMDTRKELEAAVKAEEDKKAAA